MNVSCFLEIRAFLLWRALNWEWHTQHLTLKLDGHNSIHGHSINQCKFMHCSNASGGKLVLLLGQYRNGITCFMVHSLGLVLLNGYIHFFFFVTLLTSTMPLISEPARLYPAMKLLMFLHMIGFFLFLVLFFTLDIDTCSLLESESISVTSISSSSSELLLCADSATTIP